MSNLSNVNSQVRGVFLLNGVMSKGGSRQADGAHLRTKGKTVVFVIAQRYCFDKLQANQRVDGNMLVNEKLIQDPLYSFKLRAIQWIKNPQLD